MSLLTRLMREAGDRVLLRFAAARWRKACCLAVHTLRFGPFHKALTFSQRFKHVSRLTLRGTAHRALLYPRALLNLGDERHANRDTARAACPAKHRRSYRC